MQVTKGGSKLVFAAVALWVFGVGAAHADFGCESTKQKQSQAQGEKASSGKWNPQDHAAADTEHTQQLIDAHKSYANGFVPLLPKFSTTN